MTSDDFEFLRLEFGLPHVADRSFWFGDQLLRRFFSNQRTREGDTVMAACFIRFLNDESGMVITAELVLIMTIGVLAMVVGLTAVRDAVTHELNDISHAFGAVSQSYNVPGLRKGRGDSSHAYVQGFGYNDSTDECDCNVIELVDVCGKDDPSYGDDE